MAKSKRILRVRWADEQNHWRVAGPTAGYGNYDTKKEAKGVAKNVYNKKDIYSYVAIENRNGGLNTSQSYGTRPREQTTDNDSSNASGGKIAKAASKVKSAFRRPNQDTNTLQPQLPATSGPEWVGEDADPFLAPEGPTDPYIADPDSEPDPTEKTDGSPYVPAPGVEGQTSDEAYVPTYEPGARPTTRTAEEEENNESIGPYVARPGVQTENDLDTELDQSTTESRSPVGPMAFMNQPQDQQPDTEQDQEKGERYDPWW